MPKLDGYDVMLLSAAVRRMGYACERAKQIDSRELRDRMRAEGKSDGLIFAELFGRMRGLMDQVEHDVTEAGKLLGIDDLWSKAAGSPPLQGNENENGGTK